MLRADVMPASVMPRFNRLKAFSIELVWIFPRTYSLLCLMRCQRRPNVGPSAL